MGYSGTFEFQTDIITIGFSTPDNPSLELLCTLQLHLEPEKIEIKISSIMFAGTVIPRAKGGNSNFFVELAKTNSAIELAIVQNPKI